MTISKDPYVAADKAHCIVVCTEWDEFKVICFFYARFVFMRMLKCTFAQCWKALFLFPFSMVIASAGFFAGFVLLPMDNGGF